MPNSGKSKSAINKPPALPNQVLRFLSMMALAALSYFIPKKSGLYIFGNSNGRGFSGNTRALFLKIPRAVWLTQDPEVCEMLGAADYRVSYFNWWLLLRAEYIFINDCSNHVTFAPYLIGRYKIIQLWHGTPIKKILFDLPQQHSSSLKNWLLQLMCRNFHLIVCNHVEGQAIFQSAFKNPNVELLGYPRNDFLHNTSPPPSLKDLLSNRNVILYCPTFRDSGGSPDLSQSFLQKLETYCSKNNAIFLIKRHPHDKTKLDLDSFEQIKDVTQAVAEINEILPFVNLLISDYSSIIFDFVHTNRPFVLYCPDYESYLTQNRQLYYNYFQELLGPFAKSESELLRLIETVADWSSQLAYQKSYRQFKLRFNYFQDALATERIIRRLHLKVA